MGRIVPGRTRKLTSATLRSRHYFRIADPPLTDVSGVADHLLELAAKLPREAGLP